MRRIIWKLTGIKLERRHIVHFDYRLCADDDGRQIDDAQWSRVHAEFSTRRRLLSIKPIPDVVPHLKWLANEYALHLATSRMREARAATAEWLDRHGFPEHDLHFISRGEKHATLGSFHAAVEDNYDQTVLFSQSGTPCYLIRYPWNDGRPAQHNVIWVDLWSELVQRRL